MSASTEKKLRAAAREAGTDKKTLQLQEEAKKQAKTRKRYIIAITAAVLFVALVLFFGSSLPYKTTTAITVNDTKFTPAEANYAYGTQYNNFVNNMGAYASYFGLDTSKGLQGLGSQVCALSEDGGSWRDYFKEQSISYFKQTVALCDNAKERGIELDQSDYDNIEASFAGIDDYAALYGLKDGDSLLSYNYGKGVNKEVASKMMSYDVLASKALAQYCQELAANDTEFEDYNMVNVRHILIKAVADENGEYTDEAKAEAKAKAEEILAEYEAGDKTEDSFAALAEQYSEDAGSNTNGGLYENIYKGQMVPEFDAFCFAGHEAGDTGIVYGDNGGYAGYHVIYFSGEGGLYSESSMRQAELVEQAQPWVDGLVENVTVNKSAFFNMFVGK